MEKYKTQVKKFSLLQWFFWSSWATYGAYLVYYLTEIGYSNIEIGTVMSVRTVLGLIGEPILGYISDYYHTNKKIFILGMLAIALVVLPFPYYNWWLILISTAILGFFWAPQQSILDSWILKSSDKLADNYGFMRAWGSVGFAVIVVIFGWALDIFGFSILFVSHAIILIITAIIAYFISDVKDEKSLVEKVNEREDDKPNNDKEKREKTKENPFILFKNLEYNIILLSSIFVFIPNSIIFIYLPNFIRGVGGTTSLLGVVLFLNALSEAPIFFLGKKLIKRFKAIPLLLLASIFYMIRVILVYEASGQINFLIFGALQSLSFSVLLITARFHINYIAPESLKTTAQSIFTMAMFGIGGIIASLFGGYIMDFYGMTTLYRISLMISGIGIFLIAALLVYRRLEKSDHNYH
ncbi:MFS transporter [Natronospora cellulosivora (SeqCode)]